jgi:hypothetical protein
MARNHGAIQVAGKVEPTARNPLGIGEISLETVAKTPMSEYLSYHNRIVNARSQVYYDTIRLESGTAWTSGQSTKAFMVGKDQNGAILNTGTAITKSGFDTNMIKGGQFESGTTVIVSAIEVMIMLNGRLATADTSGLISNPAPAAKTANTYSAALLLQAILDQTKLTFEMGERRQENGLFFMFPCRYGIFGVIGGDTEEAVVQNVSPVGLISMLDFPKVLDSDDDFDILIEPLAASLALPNDVKIRILLITKRIGEV